MARKQRLAKRRVNPDREFEIWSGVLKAGFDFFDDLAELDVPSNEVGRPDHDYARAAWALHGPRILAELDPARAAALGAFRVRPAPTRTRNGAPVVVSLDRSRALTKYRYIVVCCGGPSKDSSLPMGVGGFGWGTASPVNRVGPHAEIFFPGANLKPEFLTQTENNSCTKSKRFISLIFCLCFFDRKKIHAPSCQKIKEARG